MQKKMWLIELFPMSRLVILQYEGGFIELVPADISEQAALIISVKSELHNTYFDAKNNRIVIYLGESYARNWIESTD